MTLYTVNDPMQYSGSTCIQIVTKTKFIILRVCVLKKVRM